MLYFTRSSYAIFCCRPAFFPTPYPLPPPTPRHHIFFCGSTLSGILSSPGSDYRSRTLVRSSSIVMSPAPSPVRAVRSASQEASPALSQALLPPPPRVFPLPPPVNVNMNVPDFSSPRFPSAVAALSTPQRARRLSHLTASPSSEKRFGLEPPAPMMPGWSTPRRESLARGLSGSVPTPERRSSSRSWMSPERGRVSSHFPCVRRDDKGEEGWETAGKTEQQEEEEKEKFWDEEGVAEGGGVAAGGAKGPGNVMAWARVDDALKQRRRSHSSHSQSSQSSQLSQPRSQSQSQLPRGKLNGWAGSDGGRHDEPWMMEVVGKSPTSEPGSCITYSTQWSEMESQVSGGSGSVKSCAGGEAGGAGTCVRWLYLERRPCFWVSAAVLCGTICVQRVATRFLEPALHLLRQDL